MACGINVIAVFLACAIAASTALAPFPHGKTAVYNYRTTVKTTTNDENPWASQFAMQGTLDVTHDTRDPELTNAYNVVLSNVVTDMHNGEIVDYDEKQVHQTIDSNAGVIQEPFLIIYNTNGTLQAVKMGENESEWSINMKMAMASMLQLDLPENLAQEPLTFTSQEKTIHGDCSVTYNIHPMEIPQEFRVNKTFSPIDCDGFDVQEFNNVDNNHCKAKKPEQMFTESSRDVEVAKQGDGILIKKLIAYGVIRVHSATGSSYPHYVITNTTFEFLQTKEKSDKLGNFANSKKIDDLTYRKPQSTYAPTTTVDVTQGRHVVDYSRLPSHLEKLLSDAFNYIEENHLSPEKVNWDHAQTINKILHTMSYMNADQLQAVFSKYEDSDLRKDVEIKNIFLGVVAQVGTPASCNFARSIIMKNKMSTLAALDMLSKLPLNVKVPTMELLAQMEDLMKLDSTGNEEVRKAGILSFASLIYRTFKNLPHPDDSPIFRKYIQEFFNGLKEETTYEMKMVYLMGIKNIQVGGIHNILEPLIKGDQDITPSIDRFQILAMHAAENAFENDYESATRILWPIMTNKALPTKLRIGAYGILIKQAPDEKSVRKVHDYVSTEGNKHFYNFHYTTLDSIAKTADKCRHGLRTIARAILDETQYPRDSDKNIHYPLSSMDSVSYVGSSFIYGEKFDLGMIVNELTGDPEVLTFDHESVDNDGSVSDFSAKVHIEGLEGFMRVVLPRYKPHMNFDKIIQVLKKAKNSMPVMKDLKIDIILMRNGRVFMANHYNYETFSDVVDYEMERQFNISETENINYQHVIFDRLEEKQLTSDIGVPIIVESRVPVVTSLQVNYTNIVKKISNFELDVEFKKRIHGDHSMSIYNPMKDVWHAIRSQTLTEIDLPFHSQIIPGPYSNVLKFRFRERPEATEPATAGLLLRGKHFVTVDEEGTQKLKESCDTCLNQEEAHDGSRPVEDYGEYVERSYDAKTLGIKGTSYIYRSEYGYLSEMHEGYVATWDESFVSYITNSWIDMLIETPIEARYWWKYVGYDVQQTTGGCILKLEPSSEYPISEINLSGRGKMEDHDKNQTNLERSHALTFSLGVTAETISSRTNTTAGALDMDLEIDVNQGHLSNKGSLQFTIKNPGEQNFKICIDANKNYPIPPADAMKLGETKEEIDSKWTFSYGYTDNEECNRNETMVSFTVKAELSDEQKMKYNEDLENGDCSKDMTNPLYSSPNNITPRTIACINEAIKYTTVRKYTVDVEHKQLPAGITDPLYRMLTWRMEPQADGNFRFTAEFPMTRNDLDLHFMTNTSSIKDISYSMRQLRQDSRGPVMNPLWDFPLDNSRFELQFLWNYISDDIRVCTVYPGIVDRADSGKFPFTIPSDEWILLSGDHDHDRFAIFAKQSRPNYLSFRVFMKDYQVEFLTRESDNKLVAIGENIEPETGARLPGEENLGWHIRIMQKNNHFVVYPGNVGVVLHIASNYITITHDDELQGHVSGLCGHFNGSPFSDKTDIYTTKDID